jgi:hypothetical protein
MALTPLIRNGLHRVCQPPALNAHSKMAISGRFHVFKGGLRPPVRARIAGSV